MTEVMKTVLYPVKDLAKAKTLFGALLKVEPIADQPYYVGYETGALHVGLVPNGHAQGMTGATCYWSVSDIRTRLKELVAAGGQIQQDVKDVGGGMLVATVRDADGNLVGLSQAG